MRRLIALALLALLIGLPVGASVSAAEPPSSDPSASPSADPSATPEPSATTVQPSGIPTVDPSIVPAPAASAQPATDAAGRPDPSGRFLVMLKSDANVATVLDRHATRDRIKADRTFGRAMRGFTSKLTGTQRRALQADPNVLAVVPDEVVQLTAQTVPTGVSRIGTKLSPIAAIDGIDTRVDADVAIVDTGIAYHPDLNVAGGYNCSTSDTTAWRDVEGHGTHVAGTVAALDNNFGVVGVAPGARVWAVKILNDSGYGLLSWYICGLDWVLAQRDPNDSSRPLFEAVNMSVTKDGSDDNNCGATNADPLHAAICRVVAGGITVVAAAANDSSYASLRVPASYNEVITVSALADTDGLRGGLGGNACYSWGGYDKDDTFADFSNFGGDIDLIAPGKCILSTRPGNTYGISSGTSMAAPAVTGAVALYKSSRPNATPAEVKEALQYLGTLDWKWSTDPDSTHEHLLDVSKLGPLGTFNVGVGSSNVTGEAGGTMNVPITLTRSSTFFERVKFTVTNLPAGWTAPLSSPSLIGWTSNSTLMHVNIPLGTPLGRYTLQVVGTNQGRSDSVNVPITIVSDNPTANPPAAFLTYGVKLTTAVPIRISWPAATDPSSTIGAYQLQTSVNGGAYGNTVALDGATTTWLQPVAVNGTTYRYQVRAQDTAGNWSPWVQALATIRVSAVDDRSSSVVYSGSWTRTLYTYAWNGTITRSAHVGARATLTFSGRGIAIVAPRTPTRGSIDVYLDGALIKTISLKTSPALTRQVIITRGWTTVGTHTIALRVHGGSPSSLVEFDTFLVEK